MFVVDDDDGKNLRILIYHAANVREDKKKLLINSDVLLVKLTQ